jgi:uncharacterized membrane protein
MKTRFLFPYWCKYLGIGLFLVHLPVILLKKQLGFDYDIDPSSSYLISSNHLFFVVTTITMLSGLVLIAFSKEKIEDEQITQLRMDSLQVAIYFNYIILIVSLLFADKNDFKDIIHLNLWVPLLFFIILFRWKLFRNSRFTNEDAI